ncbi:MAG: NAD-glutamate dehydrogenase domain-containing protein, partial [Acidobacteriota bacterium]
MHLEIDQLADAEALQGIQQGLTDVLGDVRSAVEDWKLLRQKLRRIRQGIDAKSLPCPAEEVEETRDFLEWVDDNFFTYLGYRDYKLTRKGGKDYVVPVPESGLGVLRKMLPAAIERSKTPLPREVSHYAQEQNLLLVTKAQSKATVHRDVHMDYIGIKRFNKKGKVTGEHRFLGLFTSSAYNQSVRRIPLLRDKARRTVERSGLSPTSHDGKALVHILETFPRDELFQIDEDELFHTAMGILQLQERHRLALFVRKDHFENFISCQVYVPKDRYDTSLRKRIQEILERSFNGTIRATHSQLGDSPLARWHFVVKTSPGKLPEYDVKQIEAQLAETARSWAERLREVLVRRHGEQQGIELLRLYQEAFETAYQESFSIEVVLQDIGCMEELRTSGQLGLNLYRPLEMGGRQAKFKIYHGGDIPLSRILPILEDMGLNVITEIPYRVRPKDLDEAFYIRDFGLESGDGADIEMAQVRSNFQQTFARVWRHEAESDPLNSLVVRAGLSADEVVMLRAYTKYLLQAGVTFSQDYMSETLLHNPGLTRLLVDLFIESFDPDAGKGRNQRVDDIRAAIRRELEKVRSLDQYRILRRYKNLIRSTLRTNYFQFDEQGDSKSYLSFKLDSKKVVDLPEPRPAYEIFVMSPHFEAVHLRGGKVARGGIRWSDRREDFRTEILGLVKAQMVKNAVIVPVGAKGGFVVKNPAADRDGRKKQGVECYQAMIRGMLDLTDNLVGGQIVPPPRVVRRDDDDPYLVVAADKGTATFSDIANQVAEE